MMLSTLVMDMSGSIVKDHASFHLRISNPHILKLLREPFVR